MHLSGTQRTADARQEHRAVFAYCPVFAFLRRQVGIQILQFLRRDERDVVGQFGLDVRIMRADEALRLAQGEVNRADGRLQRLHRALLGGDDFLPVPLVDENRVDVVGRFVAADGVHVRVQPFTGLEAVRFERLTLPFRQRMDDFRRFAGFENVKGHRALDAVQVVVQTTVGRDHNRRGHTGQVQRAG